MPKRDFDVASALESAKRGALDVWVQRFLLGPGRNKPFADGLLLRQRYWTGPLLIPVDRLKRTCGPEPEMPFRVSADDWRAAVSHLVSNFESLEAYPPLIVEYRSGELNVSDGNHRLGAFRELQLLACWALIWCPDEGQLAHFERSTKMSGRRNPR